LNNCQKTRESEATYKKKITYRAAEPKKRKEGDPDAALPRDRQLVSNVVILDGDNKNKPSKRSRNEIDLTQNEVLLICPNFRLQSRLLLPHAKLGLLLSLRKEAESWKKKIKGERRVLKVIQPNLMGGQKPLRRKPHPRKILQNLLGKKIPFSLPQKILQNLLGKQTPNREDERKSLLKRFLK
jgi:hypothetical protein